MPQRLPIRMIRSFSHDFSFEQSMENSVILDVVFIILPFQEIGLYVLGYLVK